jgi:hypothetical protein
MDAIPPKELMCHRTGFAKHCKKLVTDGACCRWVMCEGKHPVTGEVFASYNCIDNWNFVLQLDMLKKMQNGFDGNQRATENFRNEMVRLNNHDQFLIEKH